MLEAQTLNRKVFCDEDDRTLVAGQEHELQRRLAIVLQRTLRRQAQEFLDRPFTQRRCRLYEYAMSDAERSLYDDVTEYLLESSLCQIMRALQHSIRTMGLRACPSPYVFFLSIAIDPRGGKWG